MICSALCSQHSISQVKMSKTIYSHSAFLVVTKNRDGRKTLLLPYSRSTMSFCAIPAFARDSNDVLEECMKMYNLSTKKIGRLVKSVRACFQKFAIPNSSFSHLKLGLLYINPDDAKTIVSDFRCENFTLIEYVLERPCGLRFDRENAKYFNMLSKVSELIKKSL